jgi:hypothetical protein
MLSDLEKKKFFFQIEFFNSFFFSIYNGLGCKKSRDNFPRIKEKL